MKIFGVMSVLTILLVSSAAVAEDSGTKRIYRSKSGGSPSVAVQKPEQKDPSEGRAMLKRDITAEEDASTATEAADRQKRKTIVRTRSGGSQMKNRIVKEN